MTGEARLSREGQALLDELAESPLPGARYARRVVEPRLPAIELAASQRTQGVEPGRPLAPCGHAGCGQPDPRQP